MLLIKDMKKNKQPHFKQHTVREYTFEPSEGGFTCPRRRDGTIDRRYKSKCADKIAQEEREIAELYDGDRDAYVKSLKEEKTKVRLKKEEAAANHPEELKKVDQIIQTNALWKRFSDIMEAETPSAAKMAYETSKNGVNEFQRYILADAYISKTRSICEDGTCDATAGTVWGSTAAKHGDGREIEEDARGEFFEAGEACLNTDIEFDPLVAGIFFDDYYSGLHTGTRPIIPFKDRETEDEENVYSAFYHQFSEEFTELWYSERKRKDWKMIPKNPFMFYFYLTDEENRQVLWDDFGDIIDSIKEFFAKEEPRQYHYMTGDHRSVQHPDYEFEGDEDGFTSLKVFPYEKKKVVKSEPSDYSQGLDFTADGHAMFILFLGCVIKRSYEEKAYKDLTIRPGTRVHMFMQAYEWVVRKQEQKLLGFKEWVPYSFSAWGASGGFLPSFLHHTPQSMANLNIRMLGNRPICNACPQKYETYYGAKWSMQNKERDPEKGNDRGLCTQFIDDLLNEMGMDPEEERNNPWYINWIGTWQQAERRLDLFKKKQQEMYDNGDPNYSFLNYMWQLLTLKLDYWVKKMFNVSNVKVDDSGEELEELSEDEAKTWKETFASMAGSFGGKLASGAKAIGEMLKIGGLLLYKLIGIVMRMPMVQEAIVKLVEDYMHKLCRDMAIKENRVKIARTSSEGDLEEFDADLGSWVTMPVSKQKEIAKKEAKIAAKNRADKMSQFMACLQQMTGSEGSSTLMKGLAAVEMFAGGAFESVLGLVEQIPGISHLLSTLGLTGEKLQIIVITGLTQTAQGTWNDIVMANRSMRKLQRLYDAIMNGMSNCTDSDNNLIIKDGGELGEGAQYCNFAWEKALFNVPYYAVMLLNELEGQGIKYWEDKKKYAEAKALAIDKLIKTTPVPGGEQADTPDNDAKTEFRIKRRRLEKLMMDELELYKKQKAMNDTNADNYMHQSTSQFGNMMQAQIKARADRERLAAKNSASAEEKAALEAEEARLKKEREEVEKEQAKQLKEDQSSSLYWWGGALLVAASVGLFVATGGASGVIQAAASAAGAAASAASVAATAVGTAAAAGATAVAGAAAAGGAAVAGAAAAIGGAAAAAGSAVAGSTLLSGALVSAVGGALKSIYDSPEMLTAIVLASSAIVYRGIAIVKEWGEHMFDGSKMILLDTIFQKQPLWRQKFKRNLSDRMENFAAKEPSFEDVKMKGAELRMTMAKVRPITIIWQGVDCDFLHLDVCNKLFSVYGSAAM